MRTIKPYTKKGRPFIMRYVRSLYVVYCKVYLNSGEAVCPGKVCDKFVGGTCQISPDRTLLPEFLPATAKLTAAQGDDGVGVVDRPAHSRLLQP